MRGGWGKLNSNSGEKLLHNPGEENYTANKIKGFDPKVN